MVCLLVGLMATNWPPGTFCTTDGLLVARFSSVVLAQLRSAASLVNVGAVQLHAVKVWLACSRVSVWSMPVSATPSASSNWTCERLECSESMPIFSVVATKSISTVVVPRTSTMPIPASDRRRASSLRNIAQPILEVGGPEAGATADGGVVRHLDAHPARARGWRVVGERDRG